MTSSRRCRLPWTLLRFCTFTALLVTAFKLGRVYEMRSDGNKQKHNRRTVDGHLRLHGSDERRRIDSDTMAAKGGVHRRPDIGEQKAVDDYAHAIEVGVDEIAGRVVAMDIVERQSDAAAADEVLDRLGRDSRYGKRKLEGDPNQRLPDDFWNGRRDDDIVIDTHRPIVNPHPFRRTIESRSLCGDQQGADVFLVCYVHTAVDHFKRRARIRETWGRQENYNNTKIRVVFLTGRTDKAGWLQDALEYEAMKYDDIVQEDFLDTYRNLSYKGIAALRWISTHCSRASYVLKTDDDMFVNMFALIKHLKDLHKAGYRRRLLMCYVWWRMHVLREGQWGIPKEEMPEDLYPVYCSGMGYVYTPDVVVAMYRVSYYVSFFWVDDVYISGCLPRALQGAVNHTDLSKAYCGAQEMGVYEHPTEWYKYIFTHLHDDDLYVKTWYRLVEIARNRTNRPIPTSAVVRPGQLADNYIPKHVLFPENAEKKVKNRKAAAGAKKKEQNRVSNE